MSTTRFLGVAACVLTTTLTGLPDIHLAGAGPFATHCRYEHEPDISPGLRLAGTTGTIIDDPARPGTIACDGPLAGIEPTGPGTLLVDARYGTEDPDDCLRGGEGTADITFTFPTAEGPQSLSSSYRYVYGGEPARDPADGPVRVHFEGDGYTGEGGALVTRGNCVTEPATRGRGRGVITFQ